MKQNTKEWIRYGSAIALIVSAIVMAFISFVVTLTIGPGVLAYIGEALTAAMAIFGISLYFVGQARDLKEEIENRLNQAENGNSNTM